MDKHASSESHREAVLAVGKKHSSKPVYELLEHSNQVTKKDNHDMLSFVIESIQYLTRQGLALRGSHSSAAQGTSEPNSNVWQLLKSYGKISHRAHTLLQRSQTYHSSDIQNEITAIMSRIISTRLAERIQKAEWYALMVDETSDVTGKEQAVICFR